jgi:hypothetical protein
MPKGRASPSPPAPIVRRRLSAARPRQIELFAEDAGTTVPTWCQLPEQARAVLTELMARLILDHVQTDNAASSKEAAHDL